MDMVTIFYTKAVENDTKGQNMVLLPLKKTGNFVVEVTRTVQNSKLPTVSL
jgi:hypothetical protein